MAYQPPPGYPPPPPSGYGPPPGYYQYGPPPYGPPEPRPPATTDPSATAALCFGLIALCAIVPFCFTMGWSVIMGVPAILFGYRAIKRIAAEPRLLTGLGRARAGVVLGWTGCAIFGFVLGMRTGHASTLAGITAIVGGLAVAGGVSTLAAKLGWGVLRAIAFASSPVLFLVGSVSGVVGARANAAMKAGLCQREENEVGTQLGAKNFTGAHSAMQLARDKCPDTETAKLAELDGMITRQEQAAKQADAERAAAEQAATAAANEKQAVATFPQKATMITASYKRALNETYTGQWSAADGDLHDAESVLSSFNGTSVASTKDWTDLSTKLVALRQKLQPQLDRIAERERKQRQAEEAKAEKETQASTALDVERGPKPSNSAWDGSIHCVESYLKQELNDPDSYAHVSTTEPVEVGPYWVVVSRFRAKNGFGALTLHQATFKIQQNQVMSMAEQE